VGPVVARDQKDKKKQNLLWSFFTLAAVCAWRSRR
jgi:hypothetical protein